MIGNYCRLYRLEKNKTLGEVGGVENIKNLSAFEHGRSSNINHFIRYINLSIILGDYENFIKGIKQGLNDEG